MRMAVRVLAVCMVGALCGVVAPALADDDLVALTASRQIQVGSLTLEPGEYLLRSESHLANHGLVLVTSADETRFYGYVLARLDCSWKLESPVDKFVFEGQDKQVLRTWIVKWKWIGYNFSPSPAPAGLTARAQKRFESRVAAK